MHDSRRTRAVLGVLLVLALALITFDYRDGSSGPVRSLQQFGGAVFGSLEEHRRLFHDESGAYAGCTVPHAHLPGATYVYRDEVGVELFQKLRYVPKRFVQRRPEGNGFVYDLDGVRRVPYLLPELLAGVSAGRHIFVVEGEKAADCLVRFGLCLLYTSPSPRD